MALHDINKDDDHRRNPSPNAVDPITNRMAHNTYSNTYRRSGGEVAQRMVFKNGLIMTVDSDDKVSSVYGYIPEVSSVPVLIIAREGYDVFVDVLNGAVERPSV